MAQSTLDIAKVNPLQNNDIADIQTLSVRKSDNPLKGLDSGKRSPSDLSIPSQSVARVEQTGDEQINLHVKPFSSAVAGQASSGPLSDENEEELLLVGNRYCIESPHLTKQSKRKAKHPQSETRNA